MTVLLQLDLRGVTCPTNTIEVVRRLDALPPGGVLEVMSDYPPARSTIPYHCEKRGFAYELSEPDERGTWCLRTAPKKERVDG